MKYIVANKELARISLRIDLRARRQSTDGRVMLNAKDLDSMEGEYADKLAALSAEELTQQEAINELNNEVWR